MKNYYEINKGTMCLLQNINNTTIVIEEDNEYTVDENIHKIVSDSCKNFGSTFKGRTEGTRELTGIKYKTPIVISEYLSIIMIPTGSTRGELCHWVSLNSIKDISKTENNECIVNFINGKSVKLDISFFIMQNQLAKATRLEYCLRKKYS